ncbi:substrate-binding domain-containing protein [Frankia sp. CNm7]|uniref:Substrate-binding domain-containing protein n=1 Tax=Frankia nepalensis TaxID=1836974 RepID=A0A937UN22_9ACTN|nr:substrate-binding domain-containing protein [Frankia nepalensis]MBL7497341.1 substrate-binding domain-containing protein [Frankia nepalensis]MBL7509702.1 substrate-binding domain-containing protein [Frankia nepalensis]MBL7516950.1 substrate-binding domain-containing protein [Frankia nepalensis]MBL7629429.1 substrate-binding domain-containing protein [Frankia nepalensis]
MLEAISNNLDTFLSALGLTGALIGWLLNRYVGQRRRVTYRVHLNTKIGVTPQPVAGMVDLEVRRAGAVVPDGSLALLRVKNAGRQDVTRADVASPLTITFPGRTVVGVEVIEPSPPVLRDMILRSPGPTIDGEKVELPAVPLNRRDRFKLLVLLSGEGSDVRVDGFIRGGRVERDTDRRRNRGLIFGGVSLLLAGMLIGLMIVNGRPGSTTAAVRCLPGQLQVEGSSAFAPVMKTVASEYSRICDDTKITVTGTGSIAGVRGVANAGADNPDAAANRLAMSDGPAPERLEALVPRPVAVALFSVVVNQSTGIRSLTVEQLRDVYAGRVTNWRDVGGADQQIILVSRGSESGTREVFERKVLDGSLEPRLSSDDCRTRNRDPAAATVRCEINSEAELLAQVARTPGAIGYAQHGAAAPYAEIDEVKLGEWAADLSTVERGLYPFWEVEIFYTYGTPAGDQLLSAFLEYSTSDTAKNLLRGAGFVPCLDRDKNYTDSLCKLRP